MEGPESTKPARRRFRPILWFCGFILSGAMLLLIGDICLIIFEVNRSAYPPKLEIMPLASTSTATGDHPTTTTLIRLATLPADLISTSTMTCDLIPVRQDAPEFDKNNIRQLNAAFRNALLSFSGYRNSPSELTLTQAIERLKKIGLAIKDLRDCERKYLGAGVDSQRARNPAAAEQIRRLEKIYYELCLDVAVQHQEWTWAYTACREGGFGWPAEVYYIKMGNGGNAMIAALTTRRFLDAVCESAGSIGSGFHPPKLDYKKRLVVFKNDWIIYAN